MQKVQTGKVLEFYSDSCLVQMNGELFNMRPMKKMPLCVGDNVSIKMESNEYLINEITKRKSKLRIYKGGKEKVIASNLDYLGIIIACKPELITGFIEKWIIISRYSNIEPFLVLNKIDMEIPKDVLETVKIYKSIGIKCFEVSAKNNIGLDALINYITQSMSIFVGQSGVGKSTLTGKLINQDLKTKMLSKGQGQHTTSTSKLYQVVNNENTYVIDSPGVRDLEIDNIPKNVIEESFVEIFSCKKLCKFTNCSHIKEEGCEVLKMLSENKISQQRYDTFIEFMSRDHYVKN